MLLQGFLLKTMGKCLVTLAPMLPGFTSPLFTGGELLPGAIVIDPTLAGIGEIRQMDLLTAIAQSHGRLV